MAHGELDTDLQHRETVVIGSQTVEPATLGALAEAEVPPGRQANLWGDAWRRLVRNRLAVVGLIVVIVFTVVAILAPWLAPYGENEVVDVRLTSHSPSWTWPFGLVRGPGKCGRGRE